jgi:hypothetical protein
MLVLYLVYFIVYWFPIEFLSVVVSFRWSLKNPCTIMGGGSFSFVLCSWAVVSIKLSSLTSVVFFSGSYVFLSSSFSIVVAGCIFLVRLGLCHPSVRSFRLLSVVSFIVASEVSFAISAGMYFLRSVLLCRRLTVFGRNLFVNFDFARTILPYRFTFFSFLTSLCVDYKQPALC